MTDQQSVTPYQGNLLSTGNTVPTDGQSKSVQAIQEAILGNRAHVAGHTQIIADAVRGIIALNAAASSGTGQAINHMLTVAKNGDADYQAIMGAVNAVQIPALTDAVRRLLDAGSEALVADVLRGIVPAEPKRGLWGR